MKVNEGVNAGSAREPACCACWRRLLLVASCCAVSIVPRLACAQAADVPYVPTPMNVVEVMLDLAQVGPGDFVIDLGSGDGRIVIAAAKKYGARGFGVDLDGALVADARREAERQGVADRVQLYERNLFITDIDKATVISFVFAADSNGSALRQALRGRVTGDTIRGKTRITGAAVEGEWQATRVSRGKINIDAALGTAAVAAGI